MYQGLPMKGRATTMTLGRKIGESLPISSAEELLDLFRELKIGDPEVVSNDGNKMHIVVNDCFCEGLPEITGNLVCDL
jgi:predicted hydrocarbon binding protein